MCSSTPFRGRLSANDFLRDGVTRPDDWRDIGVNAAAWLPHRLDCLPAGINVEGATPDGEGEMVRIFMRATSPCPVAHQRQKPGGRSLHFLPLPARRTGRRGDTPGAAPPRLSQPTRGIRANPPPIKLSRQGPDHSP